MARGGLEPPTPRFSGTRDALPLAVSTCKHVIPRLHAAPKARCFPLVSPSTGRSLTFKFNGEGLVESIKDRLGRLVSYTYTTKGGLASVSIEGKVRWEFEYTASAPYLLTGVTDGRKHTTTLEYDSSHRVIKEVEAGHERKWSYGSHETTTTEPNGAETVPLRS